MIFQDPLTRSTRCTRSAARSPRWPGSTRSIPEAPGPRAGGRDARPGRHPRAPQAGRHVPPRVLGRHAPAGHDRHGHRQQARPAHRRRADHRPRRDRAGPGARGPDRHQGRDRLGHHAHHPRPGRRGRPGRQRHGHVRRPPGRDWRTTDEIFYQQPAPYTLGLLASHAPPRRHRRRAAAARSPARRRRSSTGRRAAPFHPRCRFADVPGPCDRGRARAAAGAAPTTGRPATAPTPSTA